MNNDLSNVVSVVFVAFALLFVAAFTAPSGHTSKPGDLIATPD